MKKYVTLIALVLTIFVQSCGDKATSQTVQVLSPSEMSEILSMDSVQIVDVRTPEEFKEGHLAQAQNITYLGENWDSEIATLDKNKPVVVYCKKGGRSAKCSKLLEAAGFQKIYDLDGGLEKWKFEGRDVEK